LVRKGKSKKQEKVEINQLLLVRTGWEDFFCEFLVCPKDSNFSKISSQTTVKSWSMI
jgi:hypothetical protein